MCHYKHLSIAERESLYLLKGQGKSIRTIARNLGRAPSTISRELRRGHSGKRAYRPSTAQYRYIKRRMHCGPKPILANPDHMAKVRSLLERGWSPEEISGRLKLEKNPLSISYTTIYRAIHCGMFDQHPGVHYLPKEKQIRSKLRRKGKKYKRSGQKNRTTSFPILNTIWDRPIEAEARSCIGYWEWDTVVGKKQGARIVTGTERRSKYLLGRITPSACADDVANTMIAMLQGVPSEKIKGITPDRGKEFAAYQNVTAAIPNAIFYFADPYSPWQRGTNENTNGLLREYFPKGVAIELAHQAQLDAAVHALNTRPKKSLAWRTPEELFRDVVLRLT